MYRNAKKPDSSGSANASAKRRPIHTIQHRSIKATIWKNETAKGPVYNVVASRSYRDGDQWKDTHTFGFDDLMIVAKALSDAHSFISGLIVADRRNRKEKSSIPMREPGDD